MRENNATKDALPQRLIPPSIDCDDMPVPPVSPCTQEEYDQWFQAKVQEALDDSSPVYHSTEEVEAALEAIIERKQLDNEARERPQS